MSKTPQEWQQQLGLDTLPDEEFLQALNALEGQEVIEGGGLEAQGLVAQGVHTLQALVGALVVASAGEAFKAARQRRRLTVRKAAQAWGVSPSRISQLEAPDANLYMSTIGSAARRMGYRAKLVLEPLGEGETIVAPLGEGNASSS